MVVNLFFEASTRTRTSFEIAAQAAGRGRRFHHRAGVQRFERRIAGGHAEHAGRHAAGRHHHAPLRPPARRIFCSAISETPIINAGDGTHEHPTQALLDARTILDRGKRSEDLRVAIIGDIAHSRVARSNVYLLSKYGAEIVLCGPASLLPRELNALAPGVTLTTRHG